MRKNIHWILKSQYDYISLVFSSCTVCHQSTNMFHDKTSCYFLLNCNFLPMWYFQICIIWIWKNWESKTTVKLLLLCLSQAKNFIIFYYWWQTLLRKVNHGEYFLILLPFKSWNLIYFEYYRLLPTFPNWQGTNLNTGEYLFVRWMDKDFP